MEFSQTSELLLTSGVVEITAATGKRLPRVSIIAYAGGTMQPVGWGVIAIDLDGLAISPQTTFLSDHNGALSGIVGSGRATVENGKLLAAGELSTATEAARTILQLVRDGVQFEASVGVKPLTTEKLRAGEVVELNGRTIKAARGGLTIVRTSQLKEISIVATGADGETSVDIAAKRKGQKMTTENETSTATPPPLPTDGTADEIRATAAAESDRINAIREICADKHGDIETEAINAGWDANQTRVTVLAVIRAARPQAPAGHVVDRSTSADVREAGLLCHMGHEQLAVEQLGERATQRGRDMNCTHLLDFAKDALTADRQPIPSGRDAMINASFSTVSLPTTLGNAAGKILLKSYMESPATWRSFCDVRSTKDFKEATGIRVTDTGELTQVAPGGEIKHGSMAESTYTFKVDTFAKMLTLDRTAIINDDLGAFNEMAAGMGRGALRGVSDLVYTTILANGGSFFASGNNNFQDGAGTALGLDSVSDAITGMRTQRDSQDRDLDLIPRTLVCPPQLTRTAVEVLESENVQLLATAAGPTGNSLKGALTVESESRLANSARFTGTSELAWYLFSHPQDASVIVAFLQGKQTPTVSFFGFNTDPSTLAATWRVVFDYGVALADPKAAYFSKGES